MKINYEIRDTRYEPRPKAGSALILAVVITSLLAVVGVMFVMLSRIDSMSTSAVAENKDLSFAVDSVLAKIKQTLAEDVPGVKSILDPNIVPEYQDYPCHILTRGPDGIAGNEDDMPYAPGPDGLYGTFDDSFLFPGRDGFYGTSDDVPFTPTGDVLSGLYDDIWLASLEPEIVDVGLDKGLSPGTERDYGFRHITDLYGRIGLLFQNISGRDFNNDRISFRNLRARVIYPSDPIIKEGDKADADGDGVADSRWVKIPDKTSSKGEPVYAAIRIVDNGGMLNVNTGFMNTTGLDITDPLFDANTVDGSKQTQVNLAMLSQRGSTNGTFIQAAETLHNFRCNWQSPTLQEYLTNVVWRYANVPAPYTPFDISDELELRYRYLINQGQNNSRIENLWSYAYAAYPGVPTVPRESITDPCQWYWHASNVLPDFLNLIYDFHHISTTYNIDRIIDPAGGKMFNVNDHRSGDLDAPAVYEKLIASTGIDRTLLDPIYLDWLAQFAVNLVDFADDTDDPGMEVTQFTSPDNGRTYYGFEAQPFITELAFKIGRYPEQEQDNFYAVELHNPFNASIDLDDFILTVGIPTDVNDPNSSFCSIPLGGITIGPGKSLVIANEPAAFAIAADPNNPPAIRVPCLKFFGDWIPPDKTKPVTDPRARPGHLQPGVYNGWTWNETQSVLYLARSVGGTDIYVDRQPASKEWAPAGAERYLGRNTRDWHIVYQNLDLVTNINTLGSPGTDATNPANFVGHNFSLALPRPYSRQLITIGDIPQVLTIGPTIYPDRTVGQILLNTSLNNEHLIRANLLDPVYANIFQYLTVFDPSKDGIDNDGVFGPDNINKPLVSGDETKVPGKININTAPWFVIAQLPWMTPELARAVVAYRDKLNLATTGGPDYFRNGAPDSRSQATGLPFLREEPGFASIGELAAVINRESTLDPDSSMGLYDIRRCILAGQRGVNLAGFPDLTPDVIVDDFEERDVVFSRISNLAAVRSDVFTAYILVRIGKDGPQKRVIAILDRSDVYPNPDYPTTSSIPTIGEVELRALQSVPDPR